MTGKVVASGCFGGVGGGSKALTAPTDKPAHQRRRSFGWFGSRAHEEPQPSAGEQADGDKLAESMFDLDLDEEQPRSPRKADSKPAATTLHRRRWSFGRQVLPQPAPAPAAQEAAAADDLLVTSSDISVSSQGSPQHAAVAAAAAAAAALEQRQAPDAAAAAPSPQRSQGSYRRLWHSITSVRKGDALPAQGSGTSTEVSVESLVKAVQVGAGAASWHALAALVPCWSLAASILCSPDQACSSPECPDQAGLQAAMRMPRPRHAARCLHRLHPSPLLAPSRPASLQRLKGGQPVMEAVRDGLRHLDSRAVAALLKELSKSGLPHRAAGAWAQSPSSDTSCCPRLPCACPREPRAWRLPSLPPLRPNPSQPCPPAAWRAWPPTPPQSSLTGCARCPPTTRSASWLTCTHTPQSSAR